MSHRIIRPIGVLAAIVFAWTAVPATHLQSQERPTDALPHPAPTIRHARVLEIEGRPDGGGVVRITDAWEGADELAYAVVPSGGAAADEDAYDGVIQLPVRRIVSLATPAIAHLRDLDALDRLVAVDTAAYVYDNGVRRMIREGAVAEVGSGGSLDMETLISLSPDLVVASAFGPDDPTMLRIRAAGVPFVVLADWREQSPLGRSEWVRLFGLLTGREARAEALFAERERRYLELVERTSPIRHADRPAVMANAPWQGSWPVPGGDSYIARLFADAGGRYIWADRGGAGSTFLDIETVLSDAVAAEVWLNLNLSWRSRADARAADGRLAAFAPYRSGAMYHFNRRVRPSGANDFWESGATRPDLVLEDLVRIFHPELLPDHRLHYYRRLDP
ncbi:MAG: ABC transporter substrate-binding protein [Spirochaetales bacterium]|nr:ABC transporter substrate-binding protein [Spirochaetales bacterium]